MKRNFNLKRIIIINIFLIGLILLGTTTSNAALQSNPTTHRNAKEDTGENFIREIREMESTGQTMGLDEKIGNDLVETTPNNNIDVHMMKRTEYGAIAILSISGFGNPKPLQASTVSSTTGNETGVFLRGQGNDLITASFGVEVSHGGEDKKYYNSYTTFNDGALHIGDALGFASWKLTPGCLISVADDYFHSGSRIGLNEGISLNKSLLMVEQGFVFGVVRHEASSGDSWQTLKKVSMGVAVCGV